MSNDINFSGAVEPPKAIQPNDADHATISYWSSVHGIVSVDVSQGAPMAPIKPNPEEMKGPGLDRRIFTC